MLPNTEAREQEMEDEKARESEELYGSFPDFVEYIKDFGHDPNLTGIVKELYLSIKAGDVPALSNLNQSYWDWCEQRASEAVHKRYKRVL